MVFRNTPAQPAYFTSDLLLLEQHVSTASTVLILCLCKCFSKYWGPTVSGVKHLHFSTLRADVDLLIVFVFSVK